MFSLSARARVVVALVGRAVVTSPWVSCMFLFESRLLVTQMSDDTLSQLRGVFLVMVQ